MNLRSIVNKTIILSFFVFAGFLPARSWYYSSVTGIIYALVGIIVWTMFLYKLSSRQASQEETEDLKKNY
ncbi:MAG TPA: hypothetical protein VI548_03195 [Chitinophagaceae bacterium]|nr:hypothetical protein [Chitinophagaceae bacterium]